MLRQLFKLLPFRKAILYEIKKLASSEFEISIISGHPSLCLDKFWANCSGITIFVDFPAKSGYDVGVYIVREPYLTSTKVFRRCGEYGEGEGGGERREGREEGDGVG